MKPVTGPDGDNPITDEQIRELLRDVEGVDRNDVDLARLCYYALGQWHAGQDRHCATSHARECCAAAWNARHG